jgi:alkyl sulfatase BDS1-like metallo-beta-lactamase superfamily hydrolase
MRGTFNPEAAAGISETYEVRIADLVFEVRVADGAITTSEGRATNPDVVLTMDVETLNALLFRLLTPAAALASQRVQLKGDAKALERFVRVFGFHARPGMVDQRAGRLGRKTSFGAGRAEAGAPHRRP